MEIEITLGGKDYKLYLDIFTDSSDMAWLIVGADWIDDRAKPITDRPFFDILGENYFHEIDQKIFEVMNNV